MVTAIITSLSNVDNMIVAFPAITSRSTITSAQLTHYLESAGMEVLAKLSKRYTIPVDQIGGALHVQVANITTRLALQAFLEERAHMEGKVNPADEEFDKVRDLLDQLADGAIPLINNDGSIIAPNTGASFRYTNLVE
jgi:phage gp36-like protein